MTSATPGLPFQWSDVTSYILHYMNTLPWHREQKQGRFDSAIRMQLSTVLLLLFITAVLVELSDTARGGRGGGARSRFSSSSRSRTSSSRSSTSSSKPKITKNTPIKATTVRSSVIRSQTKLGSRSDAFKKVVAGYVVYPYALSEAPVYRDGYPMYGNYLAIRKKRAVRIIYKASKLLDALGNLCLG